jgi:peptidoglycan hydrolase-like protein with peptidoglycan-binding domain
MTEATATVTAPRRRRFPRPAVIAAGAVAVATVVALALVLRPDGGQGAADTTDGDANATATVERRDLVDRESVTGTLGYGDQRDLASPREGTLTRLPTAGTVVERGQALFDVDGEPVPLLYGDVPMYRELSSSADDGPDVRQLEENLVALGFGTSGLEVDDEFDSATAEAVRDWQESLGRDRTGTVSTSDVVFQPGPVRVAEMKAQVGSTTSPGSPVLGVTGTTRIVAVDLEAARQSIAQPGAKARVRLPSGEYADATVWSVGTVATQADANSDPTIPVVLALDDPAAGGALSDAPVTVELTSATAEGVLAVPVEALLALSEGGYAVEVVRDGRHVLVGVETGAFADGYVEVQGDVQEGEQVVVAE